MRESRHWVDEKHLEYWRACIDDTYTHVDLAPRVTMIPARVMDTFANCGQPSV